MTTNFIKFFLLCSVLCNFSYADEYVIVANKNMKELSLGEIKAIFLKKISFTNDIKVIPINLSSRDAVRSKFEQQILKMNLIKLKSYWTKQHYLGRRPPITMKSQEAIKTFVKKVDGAIGYMNVNNVDDSVKILYKWSDE
jgi:ABC-type phosphate transport system substrate-binding protein